MKTGKYILSALVMAAIFVVSGCSKLTMENYNKIKPGMSYDETVSLLGQPEKCSDVMGVKNCSWGNDKRSVNITFAGDKIVLFTSSGLR